VLLNVGRAQAAKILMLQLSISLLVALAYGILQGLEAAYSALWGGLTCVTANFFFFRKAFKFAGAQAAQQMMRGFMFGQLGKFVITVGLFGLAFVAGKVQPLALFVGYVFAQAAFWFAPVFLKQRVIVNE
jgi:ATP synthase protein I